MRKQCAFILFIWLMTPSIQVASATTFLPLPQVDPITGQEITVSHVVSYGSYIYDWPSKVDLVFWPFTDEEWIWFNPASGYASFGSDFNQVTVEERGHLSQWLAAHYASDQAPQTHREKLLWLEQVYGQRQMSDEFWCHFYRLMAYMFRDDHAQRLLYTRKALPLLEEMLKEQPKGLARIQVLYLLGEYHRRLGHRSQSKQYFEQAQTAEYEADDGTVRQGYPYIVELIQERQALRRKVRGTFALLTVSVVGLFTVAMVIHVYRRKRFRSRCLCATGS